MHFPFVGCISKARRTVTTATIASLMPQCGLSQAAVDGVRIEDQLDRAFTRPKKSGEG
jgi:hypothetical protein